MSSPRPAIFSPLPIPTCAWTNSNRSSATSPNCSNTGLIRRRRSRNRKPLRPTRSPKHRPKVNVPLSLAYQFRDENLLRLALTHPSVAHESGATTAHNQRLEFLGDAVLGLVLTQKLYAQFQEFE